MSTQTVFADGRAVSVRTRLYTLYESFKYAADLVDLRVYKRADAKQLLDHFIQETTRRQVVLPPLLVQSNPALQGGASTLSDLELAAAAANNAHDFWAENVDKISMSHII